MIDDDVMDTVAPLGMAATGLYSYLERLVGKDGTWRISIPELAHIFQQSERYVQEAMNKLIAAGWVQRVEQTNRFGMQVANVWHLPFHQKARTDGGEPTGEPRGEPRTPSEFTPINVVTTRNPVEKKPPISPKSEYSAEFEAFWAQYPKGRGSKKVSFSEWRRLSSEDRAAAAATLPLFLRSKKWQDPQYIKHCERWLRDRLWENPPIDQRCGADEVNKIPPPGYATWHDWLWSEERRKQREQEMLRAL